MHILNKWIRRLHRWLVIPFLLAIIYLIAGSVINGQTFIMPALLNVMALGSLLSLLLTGAYMFAQYYWAKWRRAK